MSKTISVIVPCYNVASYMEKCLLSIINQTYNELEIILINDGSTDDTGDIIKKHLTDKRIKYIEQQNSGVSSARNRGIEMATGELIAFADSDDYLEPQMYEKLYAGLAGANADMSVCSYNLIFDDHTDEQYSKNHGETVNIDDDVYTYFAKYCACPKPNNYIWTRLYKADIVRNSGVRFENYKLGDDTLFNFKLLPYIHRAAYISDGLYNYYQRGNSNVYTVACKTNLAKVYADTFESLEKHWRGNGFNKWLTVLPIHAASRLRSVFFYSRLAGITDNDIIQNVIEGFKGRTIAEYLTGAK